MAQVDLCDLCAFVTKGREGRALGRKLRQMCRQITGRVYRDVTYVQGTLGESKVTTIMGIQHVAADHRKVEEVPVKCKRIVKTLMQNVLLIGIIISL